MIKKGISMEQRHRLEGYVFVLPFIIGVLIFFIFPLFVSIKLSFGEVIKILGFKIKWIGPANYIKAFVVDTVFIPAFVKVIKSTMLKIPLTIILSLFFSILLNKNIKLKSFFRVSFFLPFLLGTGCVMQQLLGQDVNGQVMTTAKDIIMLPEVLEYLGPEVSTIINSFFGIIVVVLWNSGVQILLLLSGLQGINISLYESAKVDGATEWEMFWKITLPMISPILFLCMVYTLVDSFTDITNPILNYIQDTMFKTMQFGYAAAIGWIYFIFIMLLVLIVTGLMKNYIYTTEVKGGVK